MAVQRLIYIFIIFLYISCKNEGAETTGKSADSVHKYQEATIKATVHPDSINIKTSNKEADKINSKIEFDPNEEPSSVIPKNPVSKQMPLPGGVPDKHYIDSIKNARSQKK